MYEIAKRFKVDIIVGIVCFIAGIIVTAFVGGNELRRVSGKLDAALDANRSSREELSRSRETITGLVSKLGIAKEHNQRTDEINKQLADRNRILERTNESLRNAVNISIGEVTEGRGCLKEARGVAIKLQKDGRKRN